MAQELRERGINVNAVAPSIIDTPANRGDMPDADASKWVSTRQLADVITFLASERASAIHGAVIPVVGLS
ncbi:3-oxoacyl-[acyl-carrier-protein] reductase FabG [compost metagenome]